MTARGTMIPEPQQFPRMNGDSMSTPERQQDPGDHGYGGTQQEKKNEDDRDDHPLEDPNADPRQDGDRDDADD